MQHTTYQYLPVNWMDGMKMNKSHFIAQDNAHTWQLSQGISGLLNYHNYGLLPNAGKDFKIFLSTDNQNQIQLRLQQLKATTLGGFVITIETEYLANEGYLAAQLSGLTIPFSELKGKKAEHYIVLVVNPYERIPCGQIDQEEMPPRLPHTTAKLSLHLIPENEISVHALGDFQIPLGKLKTLEQKVILDDNYIPPCAAVNSHPILLEIHAEIEQFYGKMELNAMHIIQKVLQKKQQNEMAQIVFRICELISQFTATHLADFKLIHRYQPPVCMINSVASFARLIKNSMDYYTGSGKDELINYFVEWCDIKQGELEVAISNMANYEYDHLNIQESIEKLVTFTNILRRLFTSLAKLEYIGKRKDAGIFVKEQVIQKENSNFTKDPAHSPEVPTKKRNSFFLE